MKLTPTLRPASSNGPLVKAGLMLGAVFLALFFGVVSVFLPGWFVVSALLLPAVAVLMLVRPEYALAALLALTCGLIHPAVVPRLPLLGGSFAAADVILALLSLYALWTFGARAGRTRSVGPPVPGARWLALSLSLFGVSFVVAIVMSLWVRSLSATVVLGEARDLLYLLALPIALVILHEQDRQQRFVKAIVVLGALFAVGQVLQGIFNIPVFGGLGQMVALETLGQHEYGTTRSLTRGINVIVYAFLLVVGAYLLDLIRKPVFFAVAGLLLVGIVLTFGRTTYAAVLACVVLVVWWLNVRRLPRLAVWLLLAVTVGTALASIWKPDSVAAVAYRMTSIGTELESGYSAKWRYWEAEMMWPHIRHYPLAGLGLGADYKGVSGSSLNPDLNRYVHNAYLYMAGKMGLPALALFLTAMLTVFAIGRRTARFDARPWNRLVGAAGAAMMVRFLFASVTEPHFMSDYGLVNIALAGALVVLSAQRRPADPAPGTSDADHPVSGPPGLATRSSGGPTRQSVGRRGLPV